MKRLRFRFKKWDRQYWVSQKFIIPQNVRHTWELPLDMKVNGKALSLIMKISVMSPNRMGNTIISIFAFPAEYINILIRRKAYFIRKEHRCRRLSQPPIHKLMTRNRVHGQNYHTHTCVFRYTAILPTEKERPIDHYWTITKRVWIKYLNQEAIGMQDN